MSSALSWIDDDQPEHLETFFRLRAQRRIDPYNPESSVIDWGLTPNELPLRGAWASAASTFITDAFREQLSTTKVIAIWDPEADVTAADRIRAADGTVFTISGRPERDRNPWTGYQPTTLLAVEEWRG